MVGLICGLHKPTCWFRAMSPTVSLSAKGNNQLFDRNKGQLNRKSTGLGQMVTESSFTPPLTKNRLKRHFLLPSNSAKEGINLPLLVIPLLPDVHTFQPARALRLCLELFFEWEMQCRRAYSTQGQRTRAAGLGVSRRAACRLRGRIRAQAGLGLTGHLRKGSVQKGTPANNPIALSTHSAPTSLGQNERLGYWKTSAESPSQGQKATVSFCREYRARRAEQSKKQWLWIVWKNKLVCVTSCYTNGWQTGRPQRRCS